MSRSSAVLPSRPSLLAAITRLSLPAQAAAVLGGTLLLTVSSWIHIPMVPVPITLQALAVTMIGALYGGRLAAITVLAWLAEAALGAPVLAGGHGGLPYMMGPTGGYLVSFALTATLVGWTADRGLLTRSLVAAATVMVIANALIIVAGAVWLSYFVGPADAITLGVTPFILGGVLKAALGAGLVEAIRRA